MILMGVLVLPGILVNRGLWAQAPILPNPSMGQISPQETNSNASPNSNQDLSAETIVIDRPTSHYNIIIHQGVDSSGRPLDPNKTEIQAAWNRLAGGIYAGMTNTGVIRAAYRISEDTLQEGKTKEFGIGAGAFLDFPNPGVVDTNLRFRVGMSRMSFDQNTELDRTYSNQLEKSATLFHLAGIMRFKAPVNLPLGHLWFGIGGQLNYALSTKKPKNASADAKLASTYAFHAILAVGTDIPLNSYADLCLDFELHPLKGFSALAGIRTSL